MEENITRLMEVIEQESEVLEVLADSLYRQKEAAIKGDIEVLNQITDSQNRILARLNELDQKRLEYSEPIAQELGVRPEDVSTSLLKQYYSDEFSAGKNRLFSSIAPIAKKIRKSAKMNTMLIKRIMEFGEQRLKRIMDFHKESGSYNTFGKKSADSDKSGVVLNRQA